MFTSYFGNIKKITSAYPDACLVSIAGKSPSWFNGEKYKPLMPHYDWWIKWHDMFNNRLDSDESKDWYINKYYETVLNILDASMVVEALNNIANNKEIFLLCYETPEKFCHRQIVSDWLSRNGIACFEWKNDD